MPSPSASKKKISPFKPSSKKEWTETAKQELGGTNPFQKLIQTVDGIELIPYYDSTDLPDAHDFQLPVSQSEFLEPRAWSNIPRIPVNDAATANDQALGVLNHGADGILFELKATPDPNVLLKNIELPYCRIAFLADFGQEGFFHDFREMANIKKFDPSLLAGVIFWKKTPARATELIDWFKHWSQFHSTGIVSEKRKSTAEEIGALLEKAVRQIDDCVGRGVKIIDALHSVAFSVSVGSDFFLEIAKLKTLRLIWHQVMKAYDPALSLSAFIHAETKAWVNQEYEPHGNMLKGTTAAMSAILGGCDALTVEADGPDPMTARVALNVSSILREESHLGKVADPTAGSYYLENLADRLAQEAWKKFLDLSRS